MASTLSLKQLAKYGLRLAALSPFALLAAAGCSASDPTPVKTSCGAVAQCPAGQGCLNNVCTPFSTGTAGSGNPGTAGTPGIPAAGNTGIPGSAGASGSLGNPNPGGGSGNVTSTAGAGGVSATAGTGPTGTAGSVGAAGGGNVTSGAGYWTSKDWHGCSWTGVGTAGTSTATPKDFTTKPAADPYCISGTVGAEPDFKSVALLGFNLNEPSSASCVYKPVDTTAVGPAAVTAMADGLAINFVKKGTDTSFTLRVQIQGPNGSMPDPVGAADRWCATIVEPQGKVFVPWSAFTPSCWAETAALKGTPYAKQPISAVVFSVPGKKTDTPYNFCVNGFAYGSTVADAPDGSAVAGDLSGTIGGMGGQDLDFQRVKVTAGGHDYVIQNNNWGTPDGSNQTLTYKNNSFKITGTTGSGQSAPASFPSIYIGASGNTQNGQFKTTSDGLPLQLSAISSITSTFRYSPNISGDINAAYDIWFAKSPPTAAYNDGIDGFVMIWLYYPTNKMPISMTGNKVASATIAGVPWDIYVGPRGPGPMGSSSSAPVVSFVNPTRGDNSRAQSFKNVDIKKFIDAAQPYGITSSMYLTDVFGGFEIWNGSSSSNLSADEFTCVVNK
jgi:glycosyl hydrolase family 12